MNFPNFKSTSLRPSNGSQFMKNVNYENIFMLLVLVGCIIALVLKFVLYSNFQKRSLNDISRSPNNKSIPINEKIEPCDCGSSEFSLRDYYVFGSYNSAINGPYATPTVSLQSLTGVIKQGARFLDFEIYSAYGDSTPMVSCSLLSDKQGNKCGSLVETTYLLPFRSCMEVIRDYAFTNSGCMNFSDPLIVNLRLKTCQPDVAKQLANIFLDFSNLMLGPQYSYNDNKSNFGATKIRELKGKICLFVESDNMEYTSVPEFMEYVNLSKPTDFLRLLPVNEFAMLPDLKDFIDYNKRNITIAIPNPSESNPKNINLKAMQNAGVQVVAYMFWKRDSYFVDALNSFNVNGTAFVLKPEKLRFSNIVIGNPIPQDKKLSFEEKTIETTVPNINFNI